MVQTVVNPRASDRVRGFQDTIITVGDVRVALKLGATPGAEMICNFSLTLCQRIIITQFSGKESDTIDASRTS